MYKVKKSKSYNFIFYSEVCLLLYSLIEVCGGKFSKCMDKVDMDNMRTLQMELLISMLNMTEVLLSL
jgi:hypothetical protein